MTTNGNATTTCWTITANDDGTYTWTVYVGSDIAATGIADTDDDADDAATDFVHGMER